MRVLCEGSPARARVTSYPCVCIVLLHTRVARVFGLDVLDVESLQAAVLPGGGAGSSAFPVLVHTRRCSGPRVLQLMCHGVRLAGSGVGGAADVLAALMSPRLHRRVSSTASVSVDASYTGGCGRASRRSCCTPHDMGEQASTWSFR